MKPYYYVLGFLVALFAALVVFIILKHTLIKSSHDPMIVKIRQNFAMLNPDYASIPILEGNSAYTENKSVITLCLKDPETGEYYDMNTMMYVALHELAHMLNKSHGHGEAFTKKFSSLLDKAAAIGIYNPRLPIPTHYCGTS